MLQVEGIYKQATESAPGLYTSHEVILAIPSDMKITEE